MKLESLSSSITIRRKNVNASSVGFKGMAVIQPCPLLVQGVEGVEVQKFIKHFGREWHRTQWENIFYVGVDGVQVVVYSDNLVPMVYHIYQEEKVQEWRTELDYASPRSHSIYMATNLEQPAVQLIELLKGLGIWEKLS